MLYKALLLTAILLICFSTAFETPNLKERTKLEFRKRHLSNDQNPRQLTKRQERGVASLTNGFTAYVISIEVGTPPQEMEAYIDTGSADLWFQTAESLDCATGASGYSNLTLCSSLGLPYFVPEDSSTLRYNDTSFVMLYQSGYEVSNGTFARDTVQIAGLVVDQLMFGIAYQSNVQDLPMFGLGRDTIEYDQNHGIYPNFLSRLYDEGTISSKKYSIYLNSQHSDEGEISFGIEEPSKFTGDLVGHDFVSETEFFIQSNGTYFNGEQILGDYQMLIDSGTTAMILPASALKSIVTGLNATWNSEYGAYQVICTDYNTTAPDLIYQFGTQNITVGPAEYLMNYNLGADGVTETVKDANGNDVCFLGFSYDDTAILGDTFLRSVYTVFDLEENRASFARAAWLGEVTSSNSRAVSHTPITVSGTSLAAFTSLSGAAATDGRSSLVSKPTSVLAASKEISSALSSSWFRPVSTKASTGQSHSAASGSSMAATTKDLSKSQKLTSEIVQLSSRRSTKGPAIPGQGSTTTLLFSQTDRVTVSAISESSQSDAATVTNSGMTSPPLTTESSAIDISSARVVQTHGPAPAAPDRRLALAPTPTEVGIGVLHPKPRPLSELSA